MKTREMVVMTAVGLWLAGCAATGGTGEGGAAAGDGGGEQGGGTGAGNVGQGAGGSTPKGGAGGTGASAGTAGSPSGGSAGAGGGISAEAACGSFATSWCAKHALCTPLAHTRQYGDAATCTARQTQACLTALELPGVQASAIDIASCATVYSQALCSNLLERLVPAVCSPVGAVDTGAVCAHDWQCKSGYCARGLGKACGSCTKRASIHGSCSVDEDCENGLACAKGSCETFVGDNKPCATDRCLPELACTGPLASLKVCKTAPKLGEACDPDGAKAPAECDVAAMAYCDTGKKVCNAYQKIAPGEPCSLLALNETVCIGSVCAGSCQVLTADGGTCKSYLDCQAPAVCASGKCEMVSTSCQ